MNQEELKIKKRELLTEIETLQNSVGNPSVIYPSVEAQKAAIKRLKQLPDSRVSINATHRVFSSNNASRNCD